MIEYQKVLADVCADPRYQANLDWGEPRSGHPEGTIRAHIAELARNLERLRDKLSVLDYWKVKVLIHTHDTFKAQAHPEVPIADPRSHASLGKAFLAEYCDDADLIAIVQFHDEPFALYRQFVSKGRHSAERLDRLMGAIADWNLFLAFNIIDGCTSGKSRAPLKWWFAEVAGRVQSAFGIEDLLR